MFGIYRCHKTHVTNQYVESNIDSVWASSIFNGHSLIQDELHIYLASQAWMQGELQDVYVTSQVLIQYELQLYLASQTWMQSELHIYLASQAWMQGELQNMWRVMCWYKIIYKFI
jgi:hypothetical protein